MTQTAYDDRKDILPGGINCFDLVGKSNVVAGLVDASVSILNEMDYALPNGGRNKDLDHVWAILSAPAPLATDLADLCDNIKLMPIVVDS